ncbi:DNA translocase FtsK [Leptotrichia sp. OH3620_COT-345]|uniref:DNA translocase FtsK n=1 Tax=Leptotrichia sp. OH3620_COT-345 TaxID=2491048 RepID=UPI000F64D35B|nr:DNA translocase FtsK [Leptotrichia sp. OH3620_COT-345]RRD39928.1 DNA translocase FtsK [Leptotrichia sp. OH3620_COT-345]
MNKKARGGILFILGIFLIYLLINENGIQASGRRQENFLAVFLNFSSLLFGKMSWFVSILITCWGIFDFFTGNIKLKFHKSKIAALVILFLANSILLIKKAVVLPLPYSFTEAGRKLLEIGFNRESGGFIGGLVSMPLYRVMHLPAMETILNLITVMCILVLLKEVIILLYEILKGFIKYYSSDEYKKKLKILKAKRQAEKQEYIDSKRHRREELRERLIESRKKKLSFEISKKPKEKLLQKPELYSEAELIDKEKEWLQLLENQKNKNINKQKEKETEIKNEKKTEEHNIIKEKFEKTYNEGEIAIEAEDKDGFQKYEIPEEDNGISMEKEYIEEVSENGNEIIQNKKYMNEEENSEKKVQNTLENPEKYEELLKKSIEEIFKSKAMDPGKKKEIEKSIVENVAHLESVLKEFGINAKVVNYEYGPTITRYEVTIPKGVKVSKVTSLTDDIAMNLAAESIRIEAPIPGKNTIGIETPNKIKEPVHFSNIIRNKQLEKGALNVILGKNIVGQDKIIDIAKMPHLLIAGQTGSGKSVAVNTLISTLISKKSEKEVRFIMIDPKMVELMPYNGIPHLLIPVIIDPQQAAIALKWAVNEMDNRYRQLMENGVRNIVGYNSLGYVEKMPYIVVIIDELADLMMVAAGSVEESIARIAQKARAVGIHLVVATQRPSTDVITGMIKANLPSRMSFALRSQIDSRTILDTPGAEKLLGQGDMLLLENGSSKLERIQGAFISDDEVMKLTTALKANKKAVYHDEILTETVEKNKDTDPFFENAIDVIKQEGRVSISLLQRKLNVGFNRASRIYEQLKENGIINDDNQLLVDDFD